MNIHLTTTSLLDGATGEDKTDLVLGGLEHLSELRPIARKGDKVYEYVRIKFVSLQL